METSKKKPSKRAVLVSSLAAQVLGYSRTAGDGTFSVKQMMLIFPAFNSQELVHAISELLDKRLLTQKGEGTRAAFCLTDYGREGRVSVT